MFPHNQLQVPQAWHFVSIMICSLFAQSVFPIQTENCQLLRSKPEPVVEYFKNESSSIRFAGLIQPSEGQYIQIKRGFVRQDSSRRYLNPEVVTITFYCGSISFYVGSNDKYSTYIRKITVDYRLNDEIEHAANKSILFPSSKFDRYYRCDSEQTIKMTGTKNFTLLVSNLDLRSLETQETADICSLDSPTNGNLIIFIVCCALVALVASALAIVCGMVSVFLVFFVITILFVYRMLTEQEALRSTLFAWFASIGTSLAS